MSSYREAFFAARAGHTVSRAGRTVRYLTTDEAERVFIERAPHRSVRCVDGQPQFDADGVIIVDTHAPVGFDPRRLGLFDVANTDAPVEFRPTEEDLVADDWELPEGFILPEAFGGPITSASDEKTASEAPIEAPVEAPEASAPAELAVDEPG